MLAFNPDTNDLQGPAEHLNCWSDEKWGLAYEKIPYCKDVKEGLERILADLRIQVQMHSDLLYHPGRTSRNIQEQDTYWNLYYPWYSERLPRSLDDLRRRLNSFWSEGVGRNFCEGYPRNIRSLNPNSLEIQVWYITHGQYNTLKKYCSEFSALDTDMMVRRTLNPTGRGARLLSTGAVPRIAVILRHS